MSEFGVGFLLGILIGVILTWVITLNEIRDDCKGIGATMILGKPYTCFPVEKHGDK